MGQISDPYDIRWNVKAEGFGWSDEARARYELTPEKIELIDGKLFLAEAERLRMLGLLLENCGAEAAVHFGDPEIWRRAVAQLDDPVKMLEFRAIAMLRQWDKAGTREEAADFYAKWVWPEFVEKQDNQRHGTEEIVENYPEEYNWSNWSHFDSGIINIQIEDHGADMAAARDGRAHITINNRYTSTSVKENWDFRWEFRDEWRLSEAVRVSKSEGEAE